MIYVLAGIVGICAVICLAEGIVWLWEKIEAAEERSERRSLYES